MDHAFTTVFKGGRLTGGKAVALAALIAIGVVAECGEARANASERAYFAGGCFWCVEADFEKVQGVDEVVSGYTGGTTVDPSYREVTRGGTGHYEAVEIRYDPDIVSYEQLLYAFFRSVDPTDSGGQFCDRGESYRTAIFVQTEEERRAAEAAKARAADALDRDIVTPILEAGAFYIAEDYHQDYYKSQELRLTRRGPMTRADSYQFYRDACRRDERVRALWGEDALFDG